MSHKIKLSIIIVNFNTSGFIRTCLNSIKTSSIHQEKLEIIVVDNGSKDNSIDLLKKEFPYAKLIVNYKNVGFAKANNQGIKYASGEYILLLNPDTILEENTLSYVLSYLEKNPTVGIVTCRVELADGILDDACHRGFPTPWNAFCQFSRLGALFPRSLFFNGYHLGYKDLNKVHEVDACAGAFMLIRRKAGSEVGWLDEDYFWYGEDLDFCYRMKEAGWKVMFVPNVAIIHYKGVAGGIKKHSQHLTTADRETKILATKARFEVMRIFYEKHYKDKYPSWVRWLVLSGIKIKEIISLIRLI